MAPTIVGAAPAQSPAASTPGGSSTGASGSSRSQQQQQQQQKRQDAGGLVCRVKFCNSLPDIPFDPKFLAYPFEASRFVKYNTTSLEKEYKHELLTELDLGIDIDLVNPDTYKSSIVAKPDPEDEMLIADELGLGSSRQRASRHEKMKASWLRKTEYISNEANRQNQAFGDKMEAKINLKNKVFGEAEDIYKTKEKQIEAIEKTFEAVKRPVEEHHSKRGVHALQVMPLLPDFQLWQHPCAQVIFDSDPTPKEQTGVSDDVTQAMIRGMVDESGDQFVAYFLPTRETRAKRRRDEESGSAYDPEDLYEYELSREYNWNVKNKSMKGYDENYFFVFRGGGVYYNELETRVRLSKRRKIGQPGGAPTAKTKLVVRHRDFNKSEIEARAERMSSLEPPEEVEEEEEEEDDDDEEDEEGDDDDGAKTGGAAADAGTLPATTGGSEKSPAAAAAAATSAGAAAAASSSSGSSSSDNEDDDTSSSSLSD